MGETETERSAMCCFTLQTSRTARAGPGPTRADSWAGSGDEIGTQALDMNGRCPISAAPNARPFSAFFPGNPAKKQLAQVFFPEDVFISLDPQRMPYRTQPVLGWCVGRMSWA